MSELDMEKHAGYIVERVLDCGAWDDWLFLRTY